MIDYRTQAPQILRDFLAYHETIKAHSKRTVDEYFLDLRNFFRYLKQQRDPSLAGLELDEIDAVVTCARVAVSLSGTIILDGEPDQGRRAITLVPDTHVVVLKASDIVPTVPQAVDILGKNPTRPMTWIAGGSATSDIELVRVNGVHGPRFLRVVIVK